MNSNEKIKTLFAESYYEAAISECMMSRITEIFESVRSMFLEKTEFRKIDDRIVMYLGENLYKDAEFRVISQLRKKLKQNERAVTKKIINDLFETDEEKGWKKWLEVFAHELATLNHDFMSSLLKIEIPAAYKSDFQFIENHRKYLLHERWVEGISLFEYFIGKTEIPKAVLADLHMLAGYVQMYHLFDYVKTLEHFKRVKELIPGQSKTERIFGEYYIQQSDYTKAREHLQKALETDKTAWENYVILGDLHKAEKKYIAAANWYHEGLGENPGKADLYNRMLLLNEQPDHFEKQHGEINELLAKIAKLSPDLEYTALNNAAFVYQKNGQFEKALAYYHQSIELNPERIQAWVNMGYAWLEKNELDKSKTAFEKSIEIDKKAFEGYWGLVALYRKKENWEQVVVNLEHCEKLRPQWRHYIYNDFGTAYEKLGNVPEARKYYLLALENDPETNLGLNPLYDIAEFKLPLEEGVALFEKIRELKGPAFDSSIDHEIGVIYFKNQHYQKAVAHFEKAIQKDPHEPVKLEYLGLAWERAGDNDKAINYYQQAIQHEKSDKSKYYNRLAFLLTSLGRGAEAIGLLKKAIEINPQPLYYENLGYAHENSGDIEEAEKSYGKALEIAVDDKDIYENRLGIFYFNQGDNDRALQHYFNALNFFPKPVYYENTGLVFERKNLTKIAEENYRSALKLAVENNDPNQSKYYNRLAFFLSGIGEQEKAIELLNKAIELNASPVYYENLGYALEKLEKFEEAEKNYRAALQLSEYDKDIYYNRLGIYYFNRNQYEKAVEYYQKAIDIHPKAIYFENLGKAHNMTKNLVKFEEALLNAAQIEPWEGKYYFQLGWNILDIYGDSEKAKTYLKKAIEIYKKTPEIELEELRSIQFLGAAYHREGNLEKAERIFLEAYEIDPTHDSVCSFLGTIYQRKNDYPKALEFFEKAYNLNPKRVNNIMNYAEIFEITGNRKRALEIYTEGAMLDPALFEQIARIYYENEEYTEAEENIRMAISADPKNYLYHQWLGLINQKQEKHPEAREAFTAAMELSPPDLTHIYFNYIGNTWYAVGNYNEAVVCYKKAIGIKPEPVYIENIISAFKLNNQHQEAIGFLNELTNKIPVNKAMINQFGLLFFETGKLENAAEYFKKYIETDPNDYLGYENLGYTLEKLNRPEEAVNVYLSRAPVDENFYEKAANVFYSLKDFSAAENLMTKVKNTNLNAGNIYLDETRFVQGPA